MKLAPDSFELEFTTVWSFPERGEWATHTGDYRGNFSPYIPRNCILRYSKPGELVLDQFCGSGTTLTEARLLDRNAIGLDISKTAVQIAKKKLSFQVNLTSKQEVLHGDAREIKLANESVDLIITHPPYLDIIHYDKENKDDLSNIHALDDFLIEASKVASESYRVLKSGRYCAILIGDTRRNGLYVPLAYNIMQVFLKAGFKLKEDIIKKQWNCSATPFWKVRSQKFNFLLIMHEHLFVFKKV